MGFMFWFVFLSQRPFYEGLGEGMFYALVYFERNFAWPKNTSYPKRICHGWVLGSSTYGASPG